MIAYLSATTQGAALDLHQLACVLCDKPKRSGDGWLVQCPCHQDSRASLKISPGHKVPYVVKCHAGCNSIDVLREINRLTKGGQITHVRSSPVDVEQAAKRQAWLEDVWSQAHPIAASDIADRYLRCRGIQLTDFPAALRFAPSIGYWVDGTKSGDYPALLARVDDPKGQLLTLHRIYLSRDGKKASFEDAKKTMSLPPGRTTMGGAVKLFEATECLALAEGVETALAVRSLVGLPVWACLTANGLAAVELPDSVREVLVYADKDVSGAGERAAQMLAARYEDRVVQIVLPPLPITNGKGVDWLNVLESEVD